MSSTQMSIRYRPVRIGFLVRPDQIEDVVAAARLNTLLWGGLINPILPVEEDAAFTDALVKLFNVDVLVPVAEDEALLEYAKRHSNLRHPHHLQKEVIFQHSPEGAEVAYLDMLDFIAWYWEEHGRTLPPDAASFAVLPTWTTDDPLASAFAVMFGAFPDGSALQQFPESFRRGLRASTEALEVGAPVPADLLKVRSPIEATLLELTSDAGQAWGDGIYLGNATDSGDLVTFWNLRAAGQDLTFCARGFEDRLQAYTQAQLHGVAQQTRHTKPSRGVTVYGLDLQSSEIDAIKALLPEDATLIQARCDEATWNGLNLQPGVFGFARESAMASVESARGGYDVTLQLPAKTFLARTHRRDMGAHTRALVASVHPYGEFTYPGHTLAPPHLPQLHEYYSREIKHDPWRLRSEAEGIGVLVSLTDSVLYLRPLAHGDLIQRLFLLGGITAAPNQPGRLARRIISHMGNLDACRVFNIAGVRDLLQSLKPGDAVGRGEATKRIHNDGDLDRFADLYIEPRERGVRLNAAMTFDFLLKKGLFRAGVELLCDQCGLRTWCTLGDLDDNWSCDYCGAAGNTSMQLRNRGDWRFRKSGLFAKDNNQEGALPVLLALMTLARVLETSTFCYSTALDLHADGLKCETDLCVVQRGRGSREFALVIGECKASGGIIDEEDISKMEAARSLLVAQGVPVYLVFAKSAPSFTAEEIDRFREVASQGSRLILLTNRELELYHPYGDDENEELPAKYANSLEDMARNSISRYLAFP